MGNPNTIVLGGDLNESTGWENMENDNIKVHEYGYAFNKKFVDVYAKDENGLLTSDYECKEIVGEKSKSFTVDDDEKGIFSVAVACGFGMPNGIGGVEAYKEYGIDYYNEKPDQETLFSEPVIVLAENTIGYRKIWGGVNDAYVETVDDGIADWCHDVYKLKPGLEDGGIVVQSATSGSTIRADKSGDTWTVKITQPSFSDGTSYSGTYDTNYEKAKSLLGN